MMIGSSFIPPSEIWACSDSSVSRAPRPGVCLVFRLRLAVVRDLPRLGRVGQRLEGVARRGQAAETEHFHRRGGAGRSDPACPRSSMRRAHLADDGAG